MRGRIDLLFQGFDSSRESIDVATFFEMLRQRCNESGIAVESFGGIGDGDFAINSSRSELRMDRLKERLLRGQVAASFRKYWKK